MTSARVEGAWAPLRSPVSRRLWLAQVVGNLGTWMQTVGAQWVVVSGSGSATLVALVQTASTLPVVLLAAPAGVLADVLARADLRGAGPDLRTGARRRSSPSSSATARMLGAVPGSDVPARRRAAPDRRTRAAPAERRASRRRPGDGLQRRRRRPGRR